MEHRNRIVPCLLLISMFTLALCVRSGFAASGWSQAYGGTGDNEFYSLTKTTDGGYALAGYTNSSGGYDFWLVKTDSSGTMLWNRTYGGSGEDGAFSVIQTNDGGFALAGTTTSYGVGETDAWLVKTDSSGTMQWSQAFGGTAQNAAYCLIQTSDGGYALAGTTNSSGAGGFDFWLVKTNSSGSMEWNQTYGGTGDEQANSVIQTSDGGYALAGYTNSSGAGSYDFWLVKTDSSGNMLWNRTYGGSGDDEAECVIQTGDGYALAGFTNSTGAGGLDFWLVKTDLNGTLLWSKTYGGADDEAANAIVQTSDGGYALAGWTGSYGAGNYDFWLVKTDSSGTMQWSKTYGGGGDDEAFSLVQTSDGGYALAGITDSYGVGIYDGFLVKTDSAGNSAMPKSPSSSSSSSFPTLYLILVMVAIIVVVLIVAIVLVRRRRSKPSTPPVQQVPPPSDPGIKPP
jgi:predicted secreted protein